jgi:hypothetical protein
MLHVLGLNGKLMKCFARGGVEPSPVVGPGDRLSQKREVGGTDPRPHVEKFLRESAVTLLGMGRDSKQDSVRNCCPSHPILLVYPYLAIVSAQKKAGLINL